MIAYGAIMVTINLYNGGSYYMEVFSKRYQGELKKA